jgi:hypothetical protein
MNHIPFWLKVTFLTYALCFFSFLPTSVFKVYSSSAASVSHSVVIIPLTEDLACLLCCFSIHSSHRPVCIRSLCIRASASDTSVESRLTRFAMVSSHHRYLAEFTGHIVDVLVCTLNLCLLWTWLLRIRLCRKTRLVFNAFGPFVSNSICGPVAFKNVHYGGSSVQLFPNMGSFAFH